MKLSETKRLINNSQGFMNNDMVLFFTWQMPYHKVFPLLGYGQYSYFHSSWLLVHSHILSPFILFAWTKQAVKWISRITPNGF